MGGLTSTTCGGVGGGGGCGAAHCSYGLAFPVPPWPLSPPCPPCRSRLRILRFALAIGAEEASSTATREATANRVFILLLRRPPYSLLPAPCVLLLAAIPTALQQGGPNALTKGHHPTCGPPKSGPLALCRSAAGPAAPAAATPLGGRGQPVRVALAEEEGPGSTRCKCPVIDDGV